ncbi:MAG TPA: hypothetical protein VK886_05585 [Vicinamibacterales bacterium]|nr:hypothetical protein [Vicinamibacterales bacterium]
MPSFIAVIGAGELGGAAAQAIAALDCVREVRLIDTNAAGAAGKALDIMQAASLVGHATRVTATGDTRAASGAAAIVIADVGSTSREWQGEDALALLRRVWETAESERSVIVCAGASHAVVIGTAVREIRIDRRRILGSAPAAFESAVRSLAGIALDGSGADVSLMVLGLPPASIVPCWSQATFGGAAITSRLSAAQLAAIDARLPKLWPPGAYTLGSAAARVAAAAVRGSRRDLTTFVALDGEFGLRFSVAALPVRVGPDGAERIVEPELSPQERVRLEQLEVRS